MRDIDWPMWLLGAAIAFLLPLAIVAAIKDQQRWEKYAQEHQCKVIGMMDGNTAVGFASTSNGGTAVVTTTTPGKTGYLCNDGVTYWRSN